MIQPRKPVYARARDRRVSAGASVSFSFLFFVFCLSFSFSFSFPFRSAFTYTLTLTLSFTLGVYRGSPSGFDAETPWGYPHITPGVWHQRLVMGPKKDMNVDSMKPGPQSISALLPLFAAVSVKSASGRLRKGPFRLNFHFSACLRAFRTAPLFFRFHTSCDLPQAEGRSKRTSREPHRITERPPYPVPDG